jgi:PilZ domain
MPLMSLPLKTVAARPIERRRHQRVRVSLFCRYMLSDRREFPAQVVNVSPGGLAVIAPVAGAVGERVVFYVDDLGRLEGEIARHFPNGFGVRLNISDRKRDRLANQLTWLANRDTLGLPEDRRHERITPRNPRSRITLPDGTQMPVRIVDVSVSGAAIQCEVRLPMGTAVVLGRSNGRVVRHFEGGLGIEFARLLPAEVLEDTVSID